MFTKMKKITVLSVISFVVSLSANTPAIADPIINKYLPLIAIYTFQTAAAAIEIQKSTSGALTALNDLMMKDDGKSTTTATLQKSFYDVTAAALANTTLQNTAVVSFTDDFLNNAKLPYSNDITYQTMQGNLYIKPDPRQKVNPAYNYIKNVAGLNITHAVPDKDWSGSAEDKQAYRNFYTTISAIQTYNAYILSDLYAESTNGNKLNKAQNDLITQASSPDWFAQVASESIGNVFRQILMYNSQSYVVLTQLLQTQKQMLSTQAMTNTLIVLGNQFTENQLLNKAKMTMTQPGQ